jgi:membrane protein CcdC involved in cytochrome C biogenesis
MAKKKLEDFSLDKLRKRKKITFVMLCFMIGSGILFITVSLKNFIEGKQLDFGVLGSIFFTLSFSLIFYKGLKEINGEIRRRENK